MLRNVGNSVYFKQKIKKLLKLKFSHLFLTLSECIKDVYSLRAFYATFWKITMIEIYGSFRILIKMHTLVSKLKEQPVFFVFFFCA